MHSTPQTPDALSHTRRHLATCDTPFPGWQPPPSLPHARARLTTKQVNCNVLLRAPDKQVLSRRTGTNTTLYTAETKEIWRRQSLPDQQASRPRLTTDAYCTRAPNPLPPPSPGTTSQRTPQTHTACGRPHLIVHWQQRCTPRRDSCDTSSLCAHRLLPMLS